MSTTDQADSTPMIESGALARARRDRLNASQEEVAEAAVVNRDTVSAVEHGKASAKSRRLVEAALTEMEAEAGLPPYGEPLVEHVGPVDGAPGLIRVEVPNLHGGRALVVEGSPADPEALAAAVDAIMRRLYPPTPPSSTPDP